MMLDLDYRRLDRLLLKFRGGLMGESSGRRLTNKYGSSLEFADYRPYLPGDDIRRVDWALFGRSRRLYTRLNRSEVDATVNLLVDGSASMDWGEHNKGRRTLELALALAYISIRCYDRVAVGVGQKELGSYLPPTYGRGAFARIREFVSRQQFGREGNLNDLLRSFGRVLRPLQLTVVLSDFLSPGGYQQGLRELLGRRQQVLVVQVISPDERDPGFRGPLTLVDAETGAKKDLELDGLVLGEYRRTVAAYGEEIRDFCRVNGIDYLCFDVGRDPVDFLLANAAAILSTW